MEVEIDQSGKLEQLNTPTVIAFANGSKGVLLLKPATKRKIVQALRKSLIPEKDMEAIWFAIVVFLLVEILPKHASLVIDEEYTGKNSIIEEALTKLLQKHFHEKWTGIIHFKRIGKSSPAHYLAWETHRLKRKTGVRSVSYEKVLKYLK